MSTYPGEAWEQIDPADAGFRVDGSANQMKGGPYRLVIIRGGRVVGEWYQGLSARDTRQIVSAAKSFPSNLLGNTSGYMKPGEEPGTVFNYQPMG